MWHTFVLSQHQGSGGRGSRPASAAKQVPSQCKPHEPYMRTKTSMLIQTTVQLSACIYFNHSDLKRKHFQPLLFLNCVLITLGYVHMCACDFWFLRWPEEHV